MTSCPKPRVFRLFALWRQAPCDAGQIVDVWYCYTQDGDVLRRRHNRSDGTTTYAVAEVDWDSTPEGAEAYEARIAGEWQPAEVQP